MRTAGQKCRRTIILLGPHRPSKNGAGRSACGRELLWGFGYRFVAVRAKVSVAAVRRAAERGTLDMADPLSVAAYIQRGIKRRGAPAA